MEWIAKSIMMQRGVGAHREPVVHHLTEELQKQFHYTIGPYSEPVLMVKPGDRIIIDTRDAFEGALTSETDSPSALLKMPFLNPQNGPIMIEGAVKGDVIAVSIESMLPRGHDPHGICCMIPDFGALTGTAQTAMLNDPLPEKVRRIKIDTKHTTAICPQQLNG